MINIDPTTLESGLEATRTALRDGILSINIWDKSTGLSLIDWQGNPTAVALLSQMTLSLDETLSGSGFPKLKDYLYIEMKDSKSLVVINHGDDVMQGWLLDSDKINPGILLGMAIPKAVENVERARCKNPTDSAAAAPEEDSTRLNLILSASKMGLWDMVVDAGNPVSPKNVFTWTPEFRAMLGFSDESEFPNVLESWSNRLHPEHRDKTLEAFAAHINDRTGQTPFDLEYLLQLKSGKYRWYKATGETSRDEEGTPLRVVGVLKDIHEERLKSGDNQWKNCGV